MKSLNGKTIVDATSPLNLRVTTRDVSKATQKNPMTCAVAQGMLHDKAILSVRVGARIVLVEHKDRVVRYSLTKEDQKKVAAFDAADYFQPGPMQLVTPKYPLGHKTNQHHGSKKKSGARKSVYHAIPMRHAHRVGHLEGK